MKVFIEYDRSDCHAITSDQIPTGFCAMAGKMPGAEAAFAHIRNSKNRSICLDHGVKVRNE